MAMSPQILVPHLTASAMLGSPSREPLQLMVRFRPGSGLFPDCSEPSPGGAAFIGPESAGIA